MKDKHEALRNPQFARTIGEYIADSSFTHEDLAELADLSKPTISKWISGEMHPNISSLVRVCKILFGDLWWDKYLELSKMVELER
jgi:transcriptional regulator with XRE-family HTH domain